MSSVREIAHDTFIAYQEFLKIGSTKLKNQILSVISAKLRSNHSFLIRENQKDFEIAKAANLSKAYLDRLALNEKRINDIIFSCQEIEMLPDPVGRIYDMTIRPQGFRVGRMRVPIGVIGIIYEARPNVTIEAAALCLKSGNGVILRGGRDAYHSNCALIQIVQEALAELKVNPNLISFIESKEHTAVDELVMQEEFIHLIIPRGGEGLIRSVTEKSRIPVLKHYKGVCHVYIHEDADLDMALNIALNAKIQRPAVCNAAETILVDEALSDTFLPDLLRALQKKGVEIRGCPKTEQIGENVRPATEEDYFAEFLDLIIAVKVVKNHHEAVDHINKYGSGHTDTIITRNIQVADQFIKNTDSASVMINASTRLSDGNVYGLGAEIGISTDRIHARGPMGLEELTTYKWVLIGDGHIRE